MYRVVILEHRLGHFETSGYFLNGIVARWRETGIEVLVCRDPGSLPDADIAILHVDLTVVPEDYLNSLQRYPVVINGRVRDIAKRTISRHLVGPADTGAGPVIVKSDLNCMGKPEARLERQKPLWRRATSRLTRILARDPWTWPPDGYQIFPSVADVPQACWRDHALIVERFLPEQREGLYCLRTWLFFGSRETNSICYSREPVVKSRNIVRRELGDGIPEELRRIREELGFDYGKFDFTIHEGQACLFDANRTPSMGRLAADQTLPSVSTLAAGLDDFLPGVEASR